MLQDHTKSQHVTLTLLSALPLDIVIARCCSQLVLDTWSTFNFEITARRSNTAATRCCAGAAPLRIRTSMHLDRSAQRTTLNQAFCSNLLAKRFCLPHIGPSPALHTTSRRRKFAKPVLYSTLGQIAPQRFSVHEAPPRPLCRV